MLFFSFAGVADVMFDLNGEIISDQNTKKLFMLI
jgi:hypothetical protein